MGKDVADDIRQEKGGAGADACFGEGVGATGSWKGMEEMAEGKVEVSVFIMEVCIDCIYICCGVELLGPFRMPDPSGIPLRRSAGVMVCSYNSFLPSLTGSIGTAHRAIYRSCFFQLSSISPGELEVVAVTHTPAHQNAVQLFHACPSVFSQLNQLCSGFSWTLLS